MGLEGRAGSQSKHSTLGNTSCRERALREGINFTDPLGDEKHLGKSFPSTISSMISLTLVLSSD